MTINLSLLIMFLCLTPEWCIDVSIDEAIIGLDIGLSPVQCQAIIWTNAGLLSIGHLETCFTEIWIAIPAFSIKKMCWKGYLQNAIHFVSASVC